MPSSSRIVPVAPRLLSIGCWKSLLIISLLTESSSTVKEEDSSILALEIRSCNSDSISGGTPLIRDSNLVSGPVSDDGMKGGGCVGKFDSSKEFIGFVSSRHSIDLTRLSFGPWRFFFFSCLVLDW